VGVSTTTGVSTGAATVVSVSVALCANAETIENKHMAVVIIIFFIQVIFVAYYIRCIQLAKILVFKGITKCPP
jgi:hypothetical protein